MAGRCQSVPGSTSSTTLAAMRRVQQCSGGLDEAFPQAGLGDLRGQLSCRHEIQRGGQLRPGLAGVAERPADVLYDSDIASNVGLNRAIDLIEQGDSRVSFLQQRRSELYRLNSATFPLVPG